MAGAGPDLSGRVTLVVGGAGVGIGAAVATAVAGCGSAVGVITHNEAHAREAVGRLESLGVAAAAAIADVEDEASLVAAVRQISSALGTIDHLVNVVGGAQGVYQPVAEFEMAAYDRVVNRNLRYVLITCREVAGPLLEQGRMGSFVNISSTASRGAPMLGAYCAAKAGLEAISRSMALEWGPVGIRVNVVAAGTTRTGDQPVGELAPSIPMRRRGETPEVAAAVTFLLSDLSSYTTGQTLAVDGGAALGHPGGTTVSRFSVPKLDGSETGPAS